VLTFSTEYNVRVRNLKGKGSKKHHHQTGVHGYKKKQNHDETHPKGTPTTAEKRLKKKETEKPHKKKDGYKDWDETGAESEIY